MREAGLLLGVGMLCAVGAWAADGDEAEPRFRIQQYQIEGNQRLSAQRLQALVAPYTGPGRDLATIQQAVAAIERAYADAGYSAIRVILPQQEIEAGVVRLRVVEAPVAQIRVEGNTQFSTANILRTLPQLQTGDVPNLRNVATSLRLANENPAKQEQVTFRPAAEPDSVEAVVRVTDDTPLRQALILDNSGTAQTSRLRLGYALQHANLFGLDHVLGLQYVTAPDRPGDVTILGASYRIPVYGLGGALDVSASHSSVDSGLVGTTAGTYAISGSGDTVGLRYTQLLPRWDGWDQRVSLGYDFRLYNNSVVASGASSSAVPELAVHPVTLGYAGFVRTAEREWGANVAVSRNLPEGDRGGTTLFQQARVGARADYRLVRYGGYFNQLLPAGWQLRAGISGQYSADALIPGEQFGAGGIDSVRGFDERQVTGDRGNRAGIEFYSPEFSGLAGLRSQAVLFCDAAALQRNDVQPGDVPHEHLASAGVGLRMAYGSRLRLRVDVGSVVSGGGVRQPGDMMAQGNLILLF